MDKDREKALAKAVGKAIAEQRLAAGMTQEVLAERLGCGVEAVSRMERGATMPTLARLIEVAETIGCPAYLLLGISDLPSDQALLLAQRLEGVAPSDRAMLLGMLDKLTTRFKI